MTDLSAIVSQWPVVDEWSIAPAGFDWIKEGSRIQVGDGCFIGEDVALGNDIFIGDFCMLHDNCYIGDRVWLCGDIDIGDYSTVGAECYIEECCDLGGRFVLSAGWRLGRHGLSRMTSADPRNPKSQP